MFIRFFQEYILVNRLVTELGFEKALLSINMDLVRYKGLGGINKKADGFVAYLVYKSFQRRVRRIQKLTEKGVIGGNCVTIALYSYWSLHMLGYDPSIINEVCVVDGKLEAHMWVKSGGYELNRDFFSGSKIIRVIKLEQSINEWFEEIMENVVSNK